jgi:hypothetical protein
MQSMRDEPLPFAHVAVEADALRAGPRWRRVFLRSAIATGTRAPGSTQR